MNKDNGKVISEQNSQKRDNCSTNDEFYIRLKNQSLTIVNFSKCFKTQKKSD